MLLGLLFAVLSSICFGLMTVLGKLAYQAGLDASGLLQIRFSLAVPMMALVLLVVDKRLLIPSRPLLLKAAFMGGVLYGLQSTTFFLGLQTVPASTASLSLSFYPAVVAILAAIFLKQKIDTIARLAICLVIGGCALVFADAFNRSVDPLGIGLILIAVLAYSVYVISGQALMTNEHPLTFSFYTILAAAITFNLLAGPGRWSGYLGVQLAWGAALGLICTVMAISFLFLAIEKTGSTYTAIFSALDPVVGVAAAALWLGESIAAWQIIGMVLIVMGIILPNLGLLRDRRKRADGHVH